MPRGPKGEKRPADVVGNAVHVMRIATGEIEEAQSGRNEAARARGQKGGLARAETLNPSRRTEIARKAAQARRQKGPVPRGKKEPA